MLTMSVAVLVLLLLQEIVVVPACVETQTSKTERLLKTLAEQISLLTHHVEEITRLESDSGLKKIRLSTDGTLPYFSPHYAGPGMGSMHDHGNYMRTVGMGELAVVLNGVSFRTRHNDFMLHMPSTKSTEYHAWEEIPFPGVPPEVTEKETVEEQIKEMQTWFKAFKTQNPELRDYRRYFKPVLCYLEGAWTKADEGIEEPFVSDRHSLEDQEWDDLLRKIRFTSYTGRKRRLENIAYLPRVIWDVTDDDVVLAQWNYRIMCHPLKDDLPLNVFRYQDDLAPRVAKQLNLQQAEYSRVARFTLQESPHHENTETGYTLLDQLMSQIPGKDNYMGYIEDSTMGATAMDFSKTEKTPLNAAFYNRWLSQNKADAEGRKMVHRGFNDRHMFVAFNTQPKVAGRRYWPCDRENCDDKIERVSYAIPLEIIYMTPLLSWNPYNLTYKGHAKSEEGLTVTANGRRGGRTPEAALDGLNSNRFYMTPKEFYANVSTSFKDSADTACKTVGVLDPDGNVRVVTSSGIRILLPNIPDVGSVRLRYPIIPVADEGSSEMKELRALQDLLLQKKKYSRMFNDDFM